MCWSVLFRCDQSTTQTHIHCWQSEGSILDLNICCVKGEAYLPVPSPCSLTGTIHCASVVNTTTKIYSSQAQNQRDSNTLMLLHRTGASWCRAAPLWLCKHLWILTVMDKISPTMTRKTGSQACELEPATCHMGRIHKALWVQIALGPGGFPGSCSRVSISHSLESEHSQPTKPPWGCPSFSCWSLWPFAVMRVSIISEESNPALGEYPSLNPGKPVWVCCALEWTKIHTLSLV